MTQNEEQLKYIYGNLLDDLINLIERYEKVKCIPITEINKILEEKELE